MKSGVPTNSGPAEVQVVLQLGVSRGRSEVLLSGYGRVDLSAVVSEFGPKTWPRCRDSETQLATVQRRILQIFGGPEVDELDVAAPAFEVRVTRRGPDGPEIVGVKLPTRGLTRRASNSRA